MEDKKVEKLINNEEKRQMDFVQLIASENFVSKDVMKATGSVFTNKYAEGYPNARYYGGCENVDKLEELAIERLKKIFNAKFANVQPHSGAQANIAAYNAILKPGDKILSMSLNSGGHLTHGHFVSIVGKFYKIFSYEVNKETEQLDYEEIRKIAKEVKPNLIICGASAYSRIIDFKKFVAIAKEVNAYLLADIAHIAGLIVADLHPNPLNDGVDIVTSTTHKTLRGARGGIILTNNPELAILLDKSVFPGTQGGPLMNVIAGKTVSFYEASLPSFKEYQKNIISNANVMANFFIQKGVKIISGGTDNHLLMINTKKSFNKTGKEAEEILYKVNIIVNKNAIPFDEERPIVTSGIRIGTPAMTTLGWRNKEFLKIAEVIYNVLKNDDNISIKKNKQIVIDLLKEGKNEKY
ncbi:MAG: serine hydroxymethyltransferase [Candidatus Hepatoplasma vulgare]|nr:MAG: serine hydroxymethyltransferase [Candidatus Hepatoplasma sp.]